MPATSLIDGRFLSYETWGDQGGKPVLFLPGMPDSRFCRHPDEAQTTEAGVRLITVDRPGYGGSSARPGRSVADVADDVSTLADSLGLDAFWVAGWSAGGPHALAVAAALGDRVRAVGLASPVGRLDVPGAISLVSKELRPLWRVRRFPPLIQLAARLEARKARRDIAGYVERTWFKRGPSLDGQLGDIPEIRAMAEHEVAEAFRQGDAGVLDDVQALFRPWGFDLGAIGRAVHLWHGDSDDLIFLPMAESVARELLNCEFRIFEGEGHLTLFRHWREFLSTLVKS